MSISVSKRAVFRYAVMPQIKTRLVALFATGFSIVPYLMALVYSTVKLLPPNHPYVNPANIGRFGVRHVIGEASNNLVFSVKNIDQIALFFCLLIGMMLVFVQLCMVGLSFFFGSAFAAGAIPTSFAGFFLMTFFHQDQNLAGMLLDMVFGVPGIFNSCVSTAVQCQDMNNVDIPDINPLAAISPLSPNTEAFFPFPIHNGLHQMFRLYSLGLLFVATLITCYYIVTILAETAETGTPFGKRFNKVWAPIRFVVAFGLLMPIGYGLNSSQYIVLYAAKFGSGFANNAWVRFNQNLAGGPVGTTFLGRVENLASTPSIPEINGLLQFFYVARVCAELEQVKNNTVIRPYLVRSPTDAVPFMDVTLATPYADMITFAQGNTVVTMVFGPTPDKNIYTMYRGFVKPVCGEVNFSLYDPRQPGIAGDAAEYMQKYYWHILKELWFDPIFGNFPRNEMLVNGTWNTDTTAPLPDADFKRSLRDWYRADLEAVLTGPNFLNPQGVVAAQALSAEWNMNTFLERKGWAAAGVWYNRVAEMNGAISGAVFNVPTPAKYPMVMEYIKFKNQQGTEEVTIDDMYRPLLKAGKDVPFQRPEDPAMSRVLNHAYDYWRQDDGVSTTFSDPTGNIVVDVIKMLFGTDGLYSMRRNTNVHPLAQLVGVGRALVESSIRNLGMAAMLTAGGSLGSSLGTYVGALSSVASNFLVTIAGVGMATGFVLYYVVPFLPFVYFFFAVGGWIKAIFEAMVGAPLWALAHLRIDGNGLPGQAALSGYYLIFEIFLRPLLIVFGMLASISIFSALVLVLNQTFDLVTSNLTGFNVSEEIAGAGPSEIEFYRSPVDQFFFTVIYTILVYLLAISSFKLIDLIPNNILRWMGQSVPTFNDQREDAGGALAGTAAQYGQQTINSIIGGLKKR